ncbi:hypothetical protein QR680_015947 [Steinernema hermaphroditum]|uniref:Uncharacterized protein n=1 Tax=Steinernema hermaphroditum TaxID=289476 RepID=A0AA39LLR8_9BILA|nr:hypothetical protein QR680_015947 [Steinernema hermaphroditum]
MKAPSSRVRQFCASRWGKLIAVLLVVDFFFLVYWRLLCCRNVTKYRISLSGVSVNATFANLQLDYIFAPEFDPRRCDDKKLFIFVMTMASLFDQRDEIRNTWAAERHMKDSVLIFIVGRPKARIHEELLSYESSKYGDIVMTTIPDAYNYTAFKVHAGYYIHNAYCPHVPYVLRADDDIVAFPERFIHFINTGFYGNEEKAIYGILVKSAGPVRDPSHKWYIPVNYYNSSSYPTMMAVLPHCNETQISVNWIDGEIRYYPNQHLYIGPFYLCFFCVAIVPQFFLFYTCLEKSSFGQSRCYKLMLIVCVCDIVNLCNCLLAAGTFTLFEIQHCNSGIWIVYYGQFVMLFWYAYCIANLILAINRLLEFLSPRLSTILFKGDRPFFWIAVIGIYALALCALSPHPFYFYDTDAGVWYFFWLGEDSTNYFHIYNNLIKLVLVVLCYAIMLLLLKKQLLFRIQTYVVYSAAVLKMLSLYGYIYFSTLTIFLAYVGYAKPLLFQTLMMTRNVVIAFGLGYVWTVISIFTVYPRITALLFGMSLDANYSPIMITHTTIAVGFYAFMLSFYVMTIVLTIRRAEGTRNANAHWRVLKSVLIYCTPPNFFVAITLSAYCCDTIIEFGGYLQPSHWPTPNGITTWLQHEDFCAALRPWAGFTNVRQMVNGLAAVLAFYDYRLAVKRGVLWAARPIMKVLHIRGTSSQKALFVKSSKALPTQHTVTSSP